jgi:hypothetical protein
MFFVANSEERCRRTHALRAIERRADEMLKEMQRAFAAIYIAVRRVCK